MKHRGPIERAPVVRQRRPKRGAATPLDARYLLVTFIPVFRDPAGGLWLDRLWHRDLVEHFRYLEHFALAAPIHPKDASAPADLVPFEPPADFELIELGRMDTMRAALANAPRTAHTLWRTIGRSDIVHSGVAGWPLPVGWIANTIALARRRKLVIVVESAPWRVTGAADERLTFRIRAAVTEALARFFVQHADLNVFTQPEYRRTLAKEQTPACHVTPATWIEEDEILDRAIAEQAWVQKREAPVRMLVASRLVPVKGIDVLLDALAELDSRGVPVAVDVIGEGPRRIACLEASARLSRVSLRVLDPVPYGAPFFALLRDYHAVVVPNLGDEQPRIVFDSFAQAVPVLASDTDGLRPHVIEGRTGWLFERGSVEALARTLERAARSSDALAEMGLRALREAPKFTHRGMHDERWRMLHERFAA